MADIDMTDTEPVIVGSNEVDTSAPMEVTGPPVEKKEDPLKGEYTWTVENYSTFTSISPKELSPVFEIGGYTWQLLMFPRGNQSSRDQHLSLYLAVAEPAGGGAEHYQRNAAFKLTLVNQANPSESLVKEANHVFTPEANDWGFTNFILLHEIERGFLHNDALTIRVEATIRAPDEEFQPFYNSRKETGFVGLSNQGATCYMNSLLQTLYNVNQFRRAVYHMPTEEDTESMPLALQSVFYKLQFTDGPVKTNDLTKSFGWESLDAFTQHDVQELNRILCDRLEEKMKGTRVEGMVNQLFEGYTLNYIDCKNIEFKSSRREAFQDLQLDVKGCKNIYDSFDRYCEVETLEGDNQYEAEGHGKQDARKGVLFDVLPPVLNLHLKRFEYDYQKDMMVKINDKYEFYEELDLDSGKDGSGGSKYLTTAADRSVRNKYRLLAVLVHSGGVHGGHYYAYVRPDGKQWLKFDDDRVEKADKVHAVDDNWGSGEEDKSSVPSFTAVRMATRFSNAYMLVYVRESEWDTVMCPFKEEDISEHVRARLKAEQLEKERQKKERAEAHLYTMVRIATDEDLRAQIGHPKFFDLVDFDAVSLTFKLEKKAQFSEIQRIVEERLGVAPDRQRYWKWHTRQNSTYRPAGMLQVDSPSTPISEIKDAEKRRGTKAGEMAKLDLYLETPKSATANFTTHTSNRSLLLFFKHYMPGDAKVPPRLAYAGSAIVPRSSRTNELHPLMRKLAGIAGEADLCVVEEVKFDPKVMVEVIGPTQSMEDAQLEDGDILVFQEIPVGEEAQQAQFAYAKEFMEHVRNRVAVTFRRLDAGQVADGEDSEVQLELLRDMPYDDVSAALAERLGLDHPLKLRFTGQSPYTGHPRPSAIAYAQDKTLEEMYRGPGGPTQNTMLPTLFFEPIDLPLPEYERLVTHRVAFHNAKHEETNSVSVRLPKDRTVGDFLEEVRRQLPDDAHNGAPLRLMEVYHWRIWQLFDPMLPIERHLDSSANTWHLRAEVVPEDQRNLEGEGALHVHCLQVQDKEGNDKVAFPFSDPFIMSIAEGETVGQLKARVQKEMNIPDKEFASWRVVLVVGLSFNMEPLADDVVVSDRLNRADLGVSKLYGHAERHMIGFHHENKNPRRTHAHINRSATYGQERALKIKL